MVIFQLFSVSLTCKYCLSQAQTGELLGSGIMASSRLSKGPVTEVVKKFKWFPLASPEKYGGSFLKNAWAEIPEVSM